jgi:tetratricopeptide (TPR) repeat protein
MEVITLDALAEKSFKKGLKSIKINFDLSIRYIEKACMLNHHNWQYRFKLATLNADIYKYKESNNLYKEVMFIDPTKTICYYFMACNYTSMKLYDDAIMNFRKYIFTDTEGIYFKEAIKFIEKLNDKFTYNKNFNNNIKELISEAEENIRDNNYDMAIEKFEKILLDSPLIIKVRNVLSLLYFYKGRIEDAIFMASSVLKIDRRDIHANRNLEIYMYELQRDDVVIN